MVKGEIKMEIIFEKDKNRVVAIEDNVTIGKCEFLEENNTWNIIHTEVLPAYQGIGLARKLVEEVIANAQKFNIEVVATCSYAKKILVNR